MTDRILVVDDEETEGEALCLALKRLGMEAVSVTKGEAALDRMASEDFDAVLTDLGMSEMSGISLCERLLGMRPDVPVIVVTGLASLENAILAIRAGAYDFLTKPVETAMLGVSVARAVQHRRLQQEVKRLRATATEPQKAGVSGLIGSSPAMRRVHDLITRLSGSDASVLICGETGTGKELIARAIHDTSARKAAPFVAINCAAVPPSLLESELFGHSRGAFTDAKSARQGLFLQANGGTLFLDETGELPLEMQPKLLRALQERRVRPVGSDHEVPFDARIIAATNRDLETEVIEKRFREDLYYRINVVRIDVPPLRERGGDVLELATYFLDSVAARSGAHRFTLSTPVAEHLMVYDWPGNVRELENCIERSVALARFDQITVDDLPEKIRAYRADRFVVSADDTTEVVTIDELVHRYLLRVLKLVNGNKSRAAQLLGLDRRTLYRKLDRYAEREEHQVPSSPPRLLGHASGP